MILALHPVVFFAEQQQKENNRVSYVISAQDTLISLHPPIITVFLDVSLSLYPPIALYLVVIISDNFSC
jgi:hypothetical protein